MKTGIDLVVEGDHAVVLLSGGTDSAVLLAHANEYYEEVSSVYVDFGKDPSLAERYTSTKLADHYDSNLVVFDNEHISDQVQAMDRVVDVKDKSELEDSEHQDYYPLRAINMIMLGGMVADMTEADDLYVGFHEGLGNTPDSNVDVSAGMEKAMAHSSSSSFQVCMPFAGHSRGEVIAYGDQLDVPWVKTYSCYGEAGNPKKPVHCGECFSCVQRREKFQEAGVEDSAQFADSMDL